VARDQAGLFQKRQSGAHQAFVAAGRGNEGVEGSRTRAPPTERFAHGLVHGFDEIERERIFAQMARRVGRVARRKKKRAGRRRAVDGPRGRPPGSSFRAFGTDGSERENGCRPLSTPMPKATGRHHDAVRPSMNRSWAAARSAGGRPHGKNRPRCFAA
jgi:hypothetical protein